MSSEEDLRATRTRPFATTIAADSLKLGSGAGSGIPGDASGSYSPPRGVDTSLLPDQGSIVGGHYRLVRPLGEGNFGKVWVAERLDVPEHRVAMKILPRSLYAGRNVERELVMLATVGHPNVVQLKDHGIEADFVWLSMPVYEGETLGERLDRGPLTLREAYDIFLPISRAVDALHQLGLRHQDIKPENIFLARFAGHLHPVLLDLGVAAEKDSTFVAGTALYAAPEQLAAILGQERETTLGEKMDSYCIGATLLLSLVGDRHFPGSKALTRRQVVESHEIRATHPIAPSALLDLTESLRADLDQRLARWMSLDPEKRPTMAQIAEELDILLEPEREAARAEENARARQRRSLARFRMIAIAVIALIGGIGALALWKRETLRLAGQLEAARAEGAAETFQELDTCIASHAITSREKNVCLADLTDERAEHDKTLNALSKEGSGCADAVTEMKELRTKMQGNSKKHEDELRAEKTSCTSEKDKLTTDHNTDRDKLVKERETCDASVKEKESEITKLKDEREACLAAAAVASETRPTPVETSNPSTGPALPPTATPSSAPTQTPSADPPLPPAPTPDPPATTPPPIPTPTPDSHTSPVLDPPARPVPDADHLHD